MTKLSPEMINEYTNYLTKHINAVKEVYKFLCDNGVFTYSDTVANNLDHHDESKYTMEEFEPYADHWYGDGSIFGEDGYRRAVLHHYHNNPHHWNYWIYFDEDDAPYPLDIPYEYIQEMICDWATFSWINKEAKLAEWFNSKSSGMDFTPDTHDIVRTLVDEVDRLFRETFESGSLDNVIR